ncbi:HNH endonuclease [Yersinia massiliensis]|uniref:HNH endonuclease n=1 Tax=Yersinia massiliensis TaxID=419257 RepID=UPI0011A50161|nr:HNH endonuclease [Yersinia massiliensis]
MINQPFLYTDEYRKKIIEKINADNFCGKSWGDEDLADIRTAIKLYYILEQNYTCVYCQQVTKSTNGRHWDIEHIISRESAAKFMFESKNLCVTCPDCNIKKGVSKVTNSKAIRKLPLNSNDYFIIHPHIDNYEEHIEVIRVGEFYFAKSEKGEKTISLCGLNRFYKFVGYDSAVSLDSRIMLLASMISDAKNQAERNDIMREITTLTLTALIKEK